MNLELKTILDSLVSYIPLLSVSLIIAGFLKVYLYFKYFSVNIIDYIELSEVVNLFMDNIIGFFSLFLYSLINSYLLYPSTLNDKELPTTAGLMFPSFCSNYTYYGGLIIISILLLLFFLKRARIYLHEFILILLSIWIIIPFFISKIIRATLKISNSEIVTYLLVFVSIGLIIYVILACYNEIFKVVYKKFYSNYSFKLKANQGPEDINKAYIGKTKGYFFFHDSETKDITIFPSSEIAEITVKKLK